MKTKYLPLIAADFIDARGIRRTCFELCRHNAQHGRLESVVIVDFADDRISRSSAIFDLRLRWPAFERLARKYRLRSTPVTFTARSYETSIS